MHGENIQDPPISEEQMLESAESYLQSQGRSSSDLVYRGYCNSDGCYYVEYGKINEENTGFIKFDSLGELIGEALNYGEIVEYFYIGDPNDMSWVGDLFSYLQETGQLKEDNYGYDDCEDAVMNSFLSGTEESYGY